MSAQPKAVNDKAANNTTHTLDDDFGTPWRKQLGVLITAAVGLAAALAWNDAIQALIHQYIDLDDGLVGKLIYAFIMTALLVLAAFLVAHFLT